jgi:hypothetical protein
MTDSTTPSTSGIENGHASGVRDRWRALALTSGIAGLVAVVLLFTPISLISTLGEPGFAGTADEVTAFFRNADAPWVAAAEATAAVGMLAFLWFVAGFTTLLRRSEGDPAWLSTVALVSGTLVAAYGVIDASWDAASNRGDDLDPATAVFAFDLGNLSFANAWLALGSFAIASGWVLVASRPRPVPAWWGWWVIVAGIGLIAVRYFWEGSVWVIPYFVFWAWVIAVCIRLIVRRSLEPRRRSV